jgi:ribosomal protein L7/L12
MSQGHRRPPIAIADPDWDDVLAQLRADGFSPIEAIKITRAVRQVGLAEAKRIVHHSPAWADVRDTFEHLQDAALAAAEEQAG